MPTSKPQFAPNLEPGTVVSPENHIVQKSKSAVLTLTAHGCWSLFLPPYSPDLDTIETAIPELKANLRRVGATTYGDLIAAIGQICDFFTPDECRNNVKATGYSP